jgi:hypothetical protein
MAAMQEASSVQMARFCIRRGIGPVNGNRETPEFRSQAGREDAIALPGQLRPARNCRYCISLSAAR